MAHVTLCTKCAGVLVFVSQASAIATMNAAFFLCTNQPIGRFTPTNQTSRSKCRVCGIDNNGNCT